MGSPDVAGQFLRDGLVDELLLHVVPVLIGGGTRLFGELPSPTELELRSWVPGDEVSALAYAVVPRH
jgi:dihydrofolate reductase